MVEDDAAVLRVIHRMLKNLGYCVLTAEKQDETKALFNQRANEVSLLLADVNLPNENGKKLFKKLAKIKPSSKVIYMSGHTRKIIVQKSILGPDMPLIQKPFTQDYLDFRLKSILMDS